MSKRKRGEDEQRRTKRTKLSSGDVRLQRQYIESVLERSKQLLSQALKLARGFERQKLGRRQKAAKEAKDDRNEKRLASEVAALKVCSRLQRPGRADVIREGLDIYSTAETHLYKSLLKIKPAASAPALPPSIQQRLNEISTHRDVAQANVQARLFNSQPVKKIMDDSMIKIRETLGLEELQNMKIKRMRKKDFEPQQRTISQDGREHGVELKPEVSAPRIGTQHPVFDKLSDDSNEDRSKYDEYTSRLVGSSETSYDGDSQSVDYEALRTTSGQGTLRELSLSPSPEVSVSSIATDSPPPGRSRALEQSTSTSKATTFLPSLVMAGYWSGSQSATDDEGRPNEQPRKNRRGQRERRLIAEKKFGQNAKHLKKHGRAQDRDLGWDPRKGAQTDETDEFGRMKRWRGRNSNSRIRQAPRPLTQVSAASSGVNSDPVGPRKTMVKTKPAEGPLHPSWQAAKEAKEQKQSAIFQGKRVTFN
ncbi:MAG: hypothetical protein Q9209_006306 [Squamulea sp. 1 TL-2023]